MFVLPGSNGFCSEPSEAAATGDSLEQEQEDDGACHGEQERAEAPARVHLVAERDLTDEPADHRSDHADRDRREAPDRLAARGDEARDEAGDQAEEQEGDDAHSGDV